MRELVMNLARIIPTLTRYPGNPNAFSPVTMEIGSRFSTQSDGWGGDPTEESWYYGILDTDIFRFKYRFCRDFSGVWKKISSNFKLMKDLCNI